MARRVFNHAGIPLERAHYDVGIVGGGLLGLSCAFWLMALEPSLKVLIVEQGGIPQEGGATQNSSGLFSLARLGDRLEEARWTLGILQDLEHVTGIQRPHDPKFQKVGWLKLFSDGVEKGPKPDLEFLSGAARANLERLVNLSSVSRAQYDPEGGFGSASSAALHFGFGAVAKGADLMLSTRASGSVGSRNLTLERLDIDRQMRVFAARAERAQVDKLIVAAGADTARWLEQNLNLPVAIPKHYVQHLRISEKAALERQNGEVTMPVLEREGFVLRPHLGGVLISLPPIAADPVDYQARGATLFGVPVGLRREYLDSVLEGMEALPCLSWPELNLGKTALELLGALEVAREFPGWLELDAGVYALYGGRGGFELGVSSALDLASSVLGKAERPWL